MRLHLGQPSSHPERATASSPSSTAGESVESHLGAELRLAVGRIRPRGVPYKLHLEWIGEGSPTIVIDVGNDDTIHAAGEPSSSRCRGSAKHAPTTGPTSAGAIPSGPRTVKDLGDDLLTLLRVAKIRASFVFWGMWVVYCVVLPRR